MDALALKKQAMENYGLTDVEADAFMDGFVKEASANPLFSGSRPNTSPRQNTGSGGDSVFSNGLSKGLSEGLGKGLGAIALNGIVAGVARVVDSAHNAGLYRQFTEALKRVIETNRIVKNADRERVISYAETIFKFGPNVAADANILSQLLSNAVHGEGIDPNSVETITRLEERYAGKRSFQPSTYTK